MAASQLFSDFAGFIVGLAEHHRCANGVLHFVERFGVRGFLFEDLDDVKAVLGLDQVRNLPRLQRECRFFKFRNGLALHQPAQVTAFVLGARIF